MTGADFAEAMGVAERTQRSYEAGTRAPDAHYLTAALARGVDVEFVLGGSRRSIRIISESAAATAVVWAVQAVADACELARVSLSSYKLARLVAVAHRLHMAGDTPTPEHLRTLIELAADPTGGASSET